MRHPRAVVTGGSGFLGSHLCEALLARGISVVCLDNLLTGTSRNIAHLAGRRDFRFLRRDLTEPVTVPGEVGYVFHLASAASPADYLRYPIQTLEVGSQGTRNALDLAEAKGARFVLASTSEVYGDPLVHPQPESYWGNVNPVGPRSVYDEAKRFGEALTSAFRHSRGLDTAIVRIFNSYGPRMRPDDGRAIPTFLRQALTGEDLTVTGDGSQTRSICHVDDTVRGILALAASGHPGPVNVGSPYEVSMAELARLIIELTGSPSGIRFVDRPQDDPRVRRPDTSLAEEVLGWRPRLTIEEGLRATIEWFTRELPVAKPA
ncbi:NAD-dependent epimerase/dehydratase family protein [Actinomadura madurae]|uniref:NAD-dependent epimerase/dehydratase family protein n=1 Tax=Actinomadura madurae TaxID=1993 RepID=UPI002025B940|nr:NAD-dependent epimerase/dehydratase family protein [Actinomadura madurae]MCP9947463.1 NAD-dependent epimerase/dehydratase family protein [Actinomadura madurae]MCP9964225.1 NAD-dependent epimerase/dehydratase family protein [Actinomadura madurae]MCP9976704.1 NAD-dependent epimerase/dehydratase family protein [Actinomadura madurae]MCQ0011803.1 NAD-dependent epimerase/dehydratase family protein [Actinomadura madurae]MCQ0012893.1 NAD-dependent epimerase/dehydratase family protein [Actinomadura 